jgi:hypothetical protein
MSKRPQSISKRIKKDKEILIEQLAKTPIVTLACEKTGISRATFYRWKKDDSKFSNASNSAIAQGNLLINDIAESQLLSSIRDGNLTGIIFWLKNHHPSYETRIELRQAYDRNDEKLSKHQEKVLKRALKLTSIDNIPKLVGDTDGEEKENK